MAEDIIQEYENSFGVKLYKMMDELNSYYYFLERNYQKLINQIKYYEKNLDKIWLIEDRSRRNFDIYTIEFMRVLYNYLMSIYSLYDKTKSWRDYLNNQFNEIITNNGYYEKLAELDIGNTYNFLRDLRNDFTHKTASGFKHIKFSFTKSRTEHGIKTVPYIKFKELNKEVKHIVTSYNKAIGEFHYWFTKILKDLFPEDIEEANRLSKKLKDLLGYEIRSTITSEDISEVSFE